MNELELLSDLESLDDYRGDSHYIYNGKEVPRVTEIISKSTMEDHLLYWANKLGFQHKSYSKTLNEYAEFGTRVHKGIEMYLKNEDIPSNTPMNCLKSFINWWSMIGINNNIEILGQETKLVCPYYGGTYDLLMKINDKIMLVDFKTSNTISYRYYIQLAAYDRVLRDMGIQVDGYIILQLKKEGIGFKEYYLNITDNPNHRSYRDLCERTFISMLYTYYHKLHLEKHFHEINNTRSIS